MIHIDTHVVIWLHGIEGERLSHTARRRVRGEACVISPIVLLELQLLHEIGRLNSPPEAMFNELSASINLKRSDASFDAIVRHAYEISWTRDPFDRLIVANAKADSAELITSDRRILANFAQAIW